MLFSIDPPSYEADFALADANVNLAIAESNLQEAVSGRARVNMGNRSISREEYEQAVAARDKSKASVLAMEAARKKTKIHLGYTKVLSPIGGRISRRAVDPGNLVKADETLLTTIVADKEVYAYFDVDKRTYLDLDRGEADRLAQRQITELKVPVLMRLANEDKFAQRGHGGLRGQPAQRQHRHDPHAGHLREPAAPLKSGLFVRIRLPIGEPYKALLIPDEAHPERPGQEVRLRHRRRGEGAVPPHHAGAGDPGRCPSRRTGSRIAADAPRHQGRAEARRARRHQRHAAGPAPEAGPGHDDAPAAVARLPAWASCCTRRRKHEANHRVTEGTEEDRS